MADFKLGRIKFKWRGTWTANYVYVVDDIVRVNGNSYVCVTNHTSSSNLAGWYSTDFANWSLYVPGVNPAGAYSSGTTYYQNDIVQYGGSSYISLTNSNTGNTPSSLSSYWTLMVQGTADMITNNVYYVSTSTGSDSNNGTTIANAFKTLRYACSTVTGPATIYVKTGTYNEQLPITVPAGVSIIGDSMRDTIINPLTGSATTQYLSSGSTGTTIKVASNTGIYAGMTVTGTNIGSGRTVVSTSSTDTVVLNLAPSGTPTNAETLTFTYLSTDASPVPNNLSTMFYLSDSTMIQQLLMTGMTGFSPNGSYPTDIEQATIGGVYFRLNPNTTITVKSPYVKDCTAKSSGGVGAIVDGTAQSGGITSMVFWAYNIVMDSGVGIWARNGGKVEAVSCFTYYAYMGYTTSGGGLIRSLSGNNSYGTYGVVSEGYLASETPTTGNVHGNMLTLNTATLTGTFTQGEIIRQANTASIANTAASVTGNTVTLTFATQGSQPFVAGQTIVVAGVTLTGAYPTAANGTWSVTSCTTTQVVYTNTQAVSGTQTGTGAPGSITGYASAYVTSVQTGYLYYKQQYGTFNTSNVVTGVSSGATVNVTNDGGQANYLLVLRNLSAAPAVGASIQFTTGDTSAYVIQGVSTATVNAVSLYIITLAQQKATPSVDGVGIQVRYSFSLIRLQGHDFLYIGTGGVSATNYPNVNAGSANPANQIIYTFPGRVYYVATDQAGNFNVGQYFSVNQATGSATLNASAFNLSGLTSLRLGSIGAQLGAQVNEFSTDGTLSQNSPVKVPTQSAVRTYLGAAYQNFSPATDNVYTLGDATHRWNHLYVGPGSITLGTLTLTDNSGALAVTSTGGGDMTIPGNLYVTGNINYSGTITETTTTVLNVADPLIYLAQGNSGNSNDIGIVGHFTASPVGYQHTGLVRRVADNTWYLFSGDTTEPSNTITISDSTFQLDPLKVGALTASSIVSSGTTFSLANTVATTINEFGVATAINIASSAASATTLTLGANKNNNSIVINGNGTTGTAAINTNVTTGTVNAFASLTTGTLNIANGGASSIYLGGNGASVYVGYSSGNSTLSIYGNGTTGTASISTNVTNGTTNVFTSNTGTTYVGGAGAGLQIGTNSGNSTLLVSGNGTGGTATITTNVTTGTVNILNGIASTATVNIGNSTSNVLVNGVKPASTGKAIAMAMVFG